MGWIAKGWDSFIYYCAYGTFRRMWERHTGSSHLFCFYMKNYSEHHAMTEEMLNESKGYYDRMMKICTKENPWKTSKNKPKGRTIHPDAKHIEDFDYGLGEVVARYKCPNCGKIFDETIPQ